MRSQGFTFHANRYLATFQYATNSMKALGNLRMPLKYGRIVPLSFIKASSLIFIAAMVLSGCSGGSDSPDVVPVNDAPPMAPTTAVATTPTEKPSETATPAANQPTVIATTMVPRPTPTTAPPSATPTAKATAAPIAAVQKDPLPKLSPLPPVSDVTYEKQKELLSTLVQEWLAGENNIELPRLNLIPDVRDNRRGGILVHIEINGDEYDSTTQKKAELDKLMRDTYEIIYGTGYEVTEVAITAVMNGLVRPIVGGAVTARLQAFRSRLRADVAEKVDWDNKESLDFNEIWETVLLNKTWKREISEEAKSGG